LSVAADNWYNYSHLLTASYAQSGLPDFYLFSNQKSPFG
jgi:hypothetical protein